MKTSLLGKAKNLRENQTEAENILWERIRNRKLGIKFRRQTPLIVGGCNFIPDLEKIRKYSKSLF